MSWKDEVKGINPHEQKNEREFAQIPSGTYKCFINRALITEEIKGQPVKPHIDFEFEIADGKFARRKLWPRMYLTQAAYPITVKIIEKAGFTINTPEDLENALEKLCSPTAIATTIKVTEKPSTTKPGETVTFINIEEFHPSMTMVDFSGPKIDQTAWDAEEPLPF